jgi:hypothetical protein
MRKITAIRAAVLLVVPLFAQAADVMHVQWDGLEIIVGKTVQIARLGSPIVKGKALRVESDALVVQGPKSSEIRVPRTSFHIFQMRTKGKMYRIIGTTLGVGTGLAVGLIAGVAADWDRWNGSVVGGLVAAGGAAGTTAGYFAGNAADTHWITVEIVP